MSACIEHDKIDKGSKVLSLNLHYLLPEDFSGTAEEAVQELVKNNNLDRLNISTPKKVERITLRDIWEKFQNVVQCGHKSYGYCSYVEYDGDNWKTIK